MDSTLAPPISSWSPARREALLQLLRRLEQLGLPTQLPKWAAISPSSACHLNFYFSMGSTQGTIQAAFANWFFHFYNQSGSIFAAALWQVLLHSQPSSYSVLEAIR